MMFISWISVHFSQIESENTKAVAAKDVSDLLNLEQGILGAEHQKYTVHIII